MKNYIETHPGLDLSRSIDQWEQQHEAAVIVAGAALWLPALCIAVIGQFGRSLLFVQKSHHKIPMILGGIVLTLSYTLVALILRQWWRGGEEGKKI